MRHSPPPQKGRKKPPARRKQHIPCTWCPVNSILRYGSAGFSATQAASVTLVRAARRMGRHDRSQNRLSRKLARIVRRRAETLPDWAFPTRLSRLAKRDRVDSFDFEVFLNSTRIPVDAM